MIIVGVDDPTIAEWIANRDLVTTDSGLETDTESLAAQIGVLKAIKDYDLKRVISFHNRVKRAETFTTELQQVMQWIGEEHRPSGTLRTDYVSGDMPANRRKIKLDQLKGLSSDERGVLSNARCLSEGVDVPSLDGVAFVDPRSSQVDIIQAVGRAIRLSPDKKIGTIILPVFIAAGQDAAEAIEASNFKPIWGVLNALKAHDDELAAELDQARTELGKRSGSSVRSERLRKIYFDLPVSVDAEFGNALRTHLVEQVTESWHFWFGLLEAFVEREGHCRVSVDFRTNERYRLGAWMRRQRSAQNELSQEQRLQLESVSGWAWDVFDAQWDFGLVCLKEFADRVGHCRVQKNYLTPTGFKLGEWVKTQRTNQEKLSNERISRLEAMPSWVWNARDEQWDFGFSQLVIYQKNKGHLRVPTQYLTDDGYKLGSWVKNQRVTRRSLSIERQTRLEGLVAWIWDVKADRWSMGLSHLTEFINREGHCRVPKDFRTSDGFGLAVWVGTQRARSDQLSTEQKEQLETLAGWSWNLHDDQWELGFCNLVVFVEREGHCRVPYNYRTVEDYCLGIWVSVQRSNQNILSLDKSERLSALRGWVWDVSMVQFERGIYELTNFAEREGHCIVPRDFQTNDGYRLGAWVNAQRSKKDSLADELRASIEAIPGWIWAVRDHQWEVGFRFLQEFLAQEGHCRVPQNYKTASGYSLGLWVANQLRQKNRAVSERQSRLEELPGWVNKSNNH